MRLVKSRSLLASLVGMTAVVGLVFLWRQPNDRAAADIRRATTRIGAAMQAQTAAIAAVEGARASASVAERSVAVALSRAVAARGRVRVMSADDLVVRATPNAESLVVRVPTRVVERIRLDSAAVAALGMLVQRKESVIVAQDRLVTADSVELAARATAFAALERVKQPRCGRKCGIVLGVGGMLAAAVAVEQVRRTFR